MTKQEAVAYFGSLTGLAKALGCSLSTSGEWDKAIPMGRQYQIELATKGKLKADKPALRAKRIDAWKAK